MSEIYWLTVLAAADDPILAKALHKYHQEL